jgi:enoyl-CoA hydratase
MIDCATPVVSAVHGAAAGAGLAVAVLADISIVATDAKLVDGHATLGIAADDHAVAIWPLLCGLAKAKYHLLLNEPLSGEEAERIGLVTKAVEASEVEATAEEIAIRLARSAPGAVRWTKVALNNWLQMAWPAFEASLAFGIVGLAGPEAREGLTALKEKRAPSFEPGSPL